MKPCNDGEAHHWLIESPNGKKELRGVCKKCGEVREDFPSSLGEADTWTAGRMSDIYAREQDPERRGKYVFY